MKNRYVIFDVELWRVWIENGLYKFSEDQLNKAQESDDGFIGTQFGIDCYIQKPFNA